ncbi:C39 family peptidase [Lysobacter ciconiae]|uniref:C39 family peptidase n=2 Tax=Novilysobacter ciconiae TaxID=2781022 RepID=A0A7S6ZS74_9GAMM|nr:C39 family peptidase [Lysobacter ciconiae]
MTRLWPMLILCCLLAANGVPDPARAGEIAFSGVLPNGGLYTRNVESMREGRFRNIVRQQTDYSCGASSLATILRYAYHLDADETTVIQGMLGIADADLVAQRGFSLLDIKRYVESLGMRGRGYRISEDRLRSLRVPGLVLMDVRGFRHFVVLKQVVGEYVEIADPILGNRSVPIAEFLDSWPSRAVFVVVGSDFDRNTALLQPSERPSARALLAMQRPISEADLLDFGFTHADLF